MSIRALVCGVRHVQRRHLRSIRLHRHASRLSKRGAPSCATGDAGGRTIRRARRTSSRRRKCRAPRVWCAAAIVVSLAGAVPQTGGGRCRPESGVPPHDEQHRAEHDDRHLSGELSRAVARTHRCVLPLLHGRPDVQRLLREGEHHAGDRVQAGQHHGAPRRHRHARRAVRHAAVERRRVDRAGHADHARRSRSVGEDDRACASGRET